jgi:histidine triad (HIT) family protein
MSSIFTKIIRGEIPSYKVYEDERTFAFLDIHPESAGHVLVVPKVEVDKFYDLSDEDYAALWATVKKLAKHMDEVLGERVLLRVIGTDVPHVHVHLMPLDPTWEHGRVLELSDGEMTEIAEKLRLN